MGVTGSTGQYVSVGEYGKHDVIAEGCQRYFCICKQRVPKPKPDLCKSQWKNTDVINSVTCRGERKGPCKNTSFPPHHCGSVSQYNCDNILIVYRNRPGYMWTYKDLLVSILFCPPPLFLVSLPSNISPPLFLPSNCN